MTQVRVVRSAGDTVLSAAQPLRVTGQATRNDDLEPNVVDTVTLSFEHAGPHDILVVATAARATTCVRVQVSVSVVNPAPPSPGDWVAEGVKANRSSIPAGDAETSGRTAGGLTGRELEIMLLVAQGNTSRQIGQALFISPRTVEMHVQGSLLKLGCRTRAEAVRRLAELGTLPVESDRRDDMRPLRSRLIVLVSGQVGQARSKVGRCRLSLLPSTAGRQLRWTTPAGRSYDTEPTRYPI